MAIFYIDKPPVIPGARLCFILMGRCDLRVSSRGTNFNCNTPTPVTSPYFNITEDCCFCLGQSISFGRNECVTLYDFRSPSPGLCVVGYNPKVH